MRASLRRDGVVRRGKRYTDDFGRIPNQDLKYAQLGCYRAAYSGLAVKGVGMVACRAALPRMGNLPYHK